MCGSMAFSFSLAVYVYVRLIIRKGCMAQLLLFGTIRPYRFFNVVAYVYVCAFTKTARSNTPWADGLANLKSLRNKSV